MDLDSRFLANSFLHKEVSHILSLVALKLDNLAELRVLDNSTVAAKVLLEGLDKFLEAQSLGQSLNGCEGLSTIPLLDTDVDVVLLLGGSKFVFLSFRKRIKRFQIFNRGHRKKTGSERKRTRTRREERPRKEEREARKKKRPQERGCLHFPDSLKVRRVTKRALNFILGV